jgi:hypothetical protein
VADHIKRHARGEQEQDQEIDQIDQIWTEIETERETIRVADLAAWRRMAFRAGVSGDDGCERLAASAWDAVAVYGDPPELREANAADRVREGILPTDRALAWVRRVRREVWERGLEGRQCG